MKTEITDVSVVRKSIAFEVPAEIVTAELAKITGSYSRTARVPGFRAGKTPTSVIRQRFKDQIFSDAAHELIPRMVGDALREHKLQPVAMPDVRDVVLEEGKPLTFVADFEIYPTVDPGDYAGVSLRKPAAVLEVGAIDRALEQLRERAARWVPVEDRPAAAGDTLLLDLTRTVHKEGIKPEQLQNVTIELGQAANPPGFDEHLTGLAAGGQKSFSVNYPADYQIADLAGSSVDYDVTLKGIRRKELSALDDDFAKEVSDVETLDALRDRIKTDLQHEAEHEADHKVRHELMQLLESRLKGDVPSALVQHEVDRRLEDLVRRLVDQGIDPTKAEIDWKELRARQEAAAESTVRSTLVLDEIARRENLDATKEDLMREIDRYAERSGRTQAAVRAHLEKDGGVERVATGLRREKTMTWLLEKAVITQG